MPIEYANFPQRPPRTWLRFCIVVLAGSVVTFVLWCVSDFVLVRHFPSRMHDFDWVIGIPIASVAPCAAVALRHWSIAPRVVWSLAAIPLTFVLFIIT